MRNYYFFLLIVLFTVVSCNAAKPPHIIHIVADDLGWNDVSFHGSSQIPTPTIDRLGKDGVILDHFYVNPVCSPTRTALVSGRQTIHTSIYSPLSHHTTMGLNTTCNQPGEVDCLLLPAVLNALGYESHMVGKWHVGNYNWSWVPQARGFKSYYGYYTGAEDYYTHVSTAGGYDMQDNNNVDWTAVGKYSTIVFTSKAIEVIEKFASAHTDDNIALYLYLTYQAMHSVLEAPQEWIDKFNTSIPCDKKDSDCLKRRTVAAMVALLDNGIDNITKALSAVGMNSNNTLIIFHTDNGGPANGFNGNMASNMPLRGRKASTWEGGVRGVALVHGAGLEKTSYINHQMVHVSDWYFSLPSLATQGNPKLQKLVKTLFLNQPPFLLGDGIDVWKAISNNKTSPRTEIIHDKHTLRMGDYKLIPNGESAGEWYQTPLQNFTDVFTVKCPLPSKSKGCTAKNGCLYNILTDPCEQTDLSETMIDKYKEIQKRLTQYYKVNLKWHNEADSCKPDKKNGTEVPCVGTPPKMEL